jgi:hypothetical protein
VDRIGQQCEVLPIVNLYLQDSVDARVYRALHERCGLFEKFVGPMQPVLSQAIRMLIGREPVSVERLAQVAEEIHADPAVMQSFPEDDAAPMEAGQSLVSGDQTAVLLSALDGAGIGVTAESNSLRSYCELC